MKPIYSTQQDVASCIADLAGQAAGFQARLVIYFASPVFDPPSLAAGMKELFGDATVFGCTTAGEIVSGQFLEHSVVAMMLGGDSISDVALAVVPGISSRNRVADVFREFEAYYGIPMRSLPFDEYVGIVLVDGLSMAQEKLMDTIGNLTDVLFLGGSAGDDFQFRKTWVCANGRAYTDAAVVVLLKPSRGFGIIKTQSFRSTGHTLTATHVDDASRTVFSFDGKPAAEAYADALGVSIADAEQSFIHHPLGLMIENEPFVRAPRKIADGAMSFYCDIKEGMKLDVLEATDIVADTREALRKKIVEMGAVKGIINFDCAHRLLDLQQQGQTDDYARLFSAIPAIGCCTYGEEYIGHMNQTSTMLVLR